MIWEPEPIWAGETAFIIGGGPSVNDTDLSLIRGRKIIGVNNAYSLGADIGWFGDKKWIDWNYEEFKAFKGIRASCNPNNALIKNEKYDWIQFVRRGKVFGLDTTKGFVSWNKSSGNSAISLAYQLGCRRIVLIGFDLDDDENGNSNYHSGHKQKNNPPYTKFLEALKIIAEDAKELGVEILNASPTSACNSFPKGELHEFIEGDIMSDDLTSEEIPTPEKIVSFVTSLKSGDYTVADVISLASQVRSNLTVPYEFICYTDIPIGDPSIVEASYRHSLSAWERQGPAIMTDLNMRIVGNIDKLAEMALSCTKDEIYLCRPWNKKMSAMGHWANRIVIYNGDWSWMSKEVKTDKWISVHISEQLKNHRVKIIQDKFPRIRSHVHDDLSNASIIVFNNRFKASRWTKDV